MKLLNLLQQKYVDGIHLISLHTRVNYYIYHLKLYH